MENTCYNNRINKNRNVKQKEQQKNIIISRLILYEDIL